ncbi:G-type lectin S-receptor-like serine/threonine-protein kinase [Hibiscus syriacus]|uniref:Receptor-like serine/threonine-protein kinase n=2 Tax=Hibiscus syriacus TaxID=106335 RepID=A0A6A2XYJ1_HIBSY|nr:G-type lectin S-receptor-like serine/threonine-protein kinase At4g27290 isoform X1 [Hibiscus syriacus]KAE8659744.1 G-type lectin S-receptor-like serine/threonine-protein kinase [Hibiscus syriacus]
MGKLKGNLLFFLSLVSLFLESSTAIDTITPARSIDDNQTIVSAGHKFELGFFNVGNSNDRYLGIWYKNLPVRTVVWVANRESPLVNSSGLLTLGDDGTLSIVNDSRNIIWSSISFLAAKDPVAVLLDTGNFVVKDAGDDNEGNYIWQSFDYPSDTLLPGMKLGWNKKTSLNIHLTSWKSSDDPSPGEYTYSVDHRGLPQLVLRKGSDKKFRSGPWYGTQFSGVPVLKVNPVFTPIFVSNADEVYYSYNITANIPSRFVLSQSGSVQHLSWNVRHSDWYLIFTVEQDRCDNYGLCGSYGICNINKTPNCDCLKGFEPKLSKDWDVLDWSGGCVRKDQRVCHEGEGFLKFTGLKLPDASQFRVNVSMKIEDCEAECLKNCSCTAYAKLDIKGTGNGCVIWYEDLIDIREAPQYGQDLYIKMASSALERHADTSKNRKNVTIATTISVASAMIILVFIGWFVNWKKNMIRAHQPENQVTISKVESEDDLELPLVEFATVQAATNNFSAANKIGEGGYGPVYKGELQSGQEVAVKRLAENSGQGLQEFKNEVLLISKLQHRNLVKLLGCCIEREERMLIYEYMPNRSLDSFIFDETRRPSLDWRRRHDIIVGISRGLLYLHRDSRLRIIHRDLKASNVLLDNDMNPKISDFGMARTFLGDQTEANTKRIVGTYGYMPPEYAIDGHFSLKSDVFSFGVILLEMVSGKKNRGFFHSTHKLNLLGHAWKLWNEEKALELVDELMEQGFPEEEALRCVQVGLLCVQQRPEDRPVMQTVVLMLDSESMTLPQPGRPGFYAERCLSETDSSSIGNLISNEMTVTLLEGR